LALFAILYSMFNKNFYKFLFSFVGVISTVLLIILTLGVLGVH